MLYHFGSNWVIRAIKDCFRTSWTNSNYNQRRTVLLSCVENFRKLIKFFYEDDEVYVNDRLELQSRLDLLVSEVASRTGLKVDGMVTKGKAYKKIVEVADLVCAKLIVMGTNGSPLSFSKK